MPPAENDALDAGACQDVLERTPISGGQHDWLIAFAIEGAGNLDGNPFSTSGVEGIEQHRYAPRSVGVRQACLDER